MVRRCLEVTPYGVVKRLNGIARRLADHSAAVLEDQQARAGARPAAIPMAAGDVRFTLWLPGGGAILSSDYGRLSSTGSPHEPVMLACLTRMLRQAPASRFMDIGAHLGYYACYASALLDDRQEVYAVESNPVYADAVREAARLNGFSQLRVFDAALSDRVEPVNIDGLTVCRDGGQSGGTMAVTLDDLCKREQISPNIIKMDVHGAEAKIIPGMHGTLADLDCILLEMHNPYLLREYSPGVSRTAMLDALEAAGLTLYYVGGHAERFQSASDFPSLLNGKGFCYQRLDRGLRDLVLFDRSFDTFVLGLRQRNIEALLGPSVSPANA